MTLNGLWEKHPMPFPMEEGNGRLYVVQEVDVKHLIENPQDIFVLNHIRKIYRSERVAAISIRNVGGEFLYGMRGEGVFSLSPVLPIRGDSVYMAVYSTGENRKLFAGVLRYN